MRKNIEHETKITQTGKTGGIKTQHSSVDAITKNFRKIGGREMKKVIVIKSEMSGYYIVEIWGKGKISVRSFPPTDSHSAFALAYDLAQVLQYKTSYMEV